MAIHTTDTGEPISPVRVQAVYNTSLPTYTNGQRTDLQTSVNGALITQLQGASGTGVSSLSDSADGLAASGSNSGLKVHTREYVFNGTTWDRMRGDSTGTQVIEGMSSSLNITAATVVKASAGRVFRINVNTAGSTAGTLSDVATTGAVAAANLVFSIPNAVGTYYLNWPHTTGIVITPGTGQVLSVSYA